jgi:hypothetical protein
MSLDPVNYQQGANSLELPIVYEVPLLNASIPTAA